MTKNHKYIVRYRFNGNPYFDVGSIHAVTMADLERLIKEFEAKLGDPYDPDDKRWTARWLERFRKGYDTKAAGRGLKQREKRSRRRTNRCG
ncbi:MAG: hypothetical protein ACRC1K_18340 [Planctomycetia bacterium]